MTTHIQSSFISRFFKTTLYSISHRSTRFAVIVTVVLVGGFLIFGTSQKKEAETHTISLGNLKQYVEVSGSVQPSKDASLSFQTGGVISFVGVKVGDVVRQGQLLASLDSGDQEASLLQARASLENAQITLEQLTQGPRKEEIAIKQQTFDNAESSLTQTYLSIPDVIRNVEGTTADIIKNKLSSLFVNQGDRYVLSFTSCDQSLQSMIEKSRTDIEVVLANYQKKSSVITTLSSREAIDQVLEEAYGATVLTNTLVTHISNLLLLGCSAQNTALDTPRTTLSTVRSTMSTLFTEMTTKRSALTTAKNTYSQASRELDLTKAGTDPYKIKAQAAVVTQAEASLLQARQAVAKTRIVAPFPGIIGSVSITQGETATLGKVAMSIITSDAFEIEAKVPEIDIVKVQQGSDVEVTLDAYGKGVVFPALVTQISPIATTEGTVPVYKVTITFKEQDARIKSGMTANVSIVTENKSSVLLVPARFVTINSNADGVVILRRNDAQVEQAITLGSRSKDGSIEVLSGLVPGDVVVLPEIGVRQAQKETE